METCFAASHAAAVKHNVVTIEKAMGKIKRYLQLTTVMAAKQRANAHVVPRMSAKDSGGRPPLGIGPGKTRCVSGVKKQQKNSSDSIKHRCFHSCLQRSRQRAPLSCRVGSNCTTTEIVRLTEFLAIPGRLTRRSCKRMGLSLSSLSSVLTTMRFERASGPITRFCPM